jgi:hypothetical protein
MPSPLNPATALCWASGTRSGDGAGSRRRVMKEGTQEAGGQYPGAFLGLIDLHWRAKGQIKTAVVMTSGFPSPISLGRGEPLRASRDCGRNRDVAVLLWMLPAFLTHLIQPSFVPTPLAHCNRAVTLRRVFCTKPLPKFRVTIHCEAVPTFSSDGCDNLGRQVFSLLDFLQSHVEFFGYIRTRRDQFDGEVRTRRAICCPMNHEDAIGETWISLLFGGQFALESIHHCFDVAREHNLVAWAAAKQVDPRQAIRRGHGGRSQGRRGMTLDTIYRPTLRPLVRLIRGPRPFAEFPRRGSGISRRRR